MHFQEDIETLQEDAEDIINFIPNEEFVSIEKAPAAMLTPPRLSPERPPQAKSRSSPARSPRTDTMEDYFKFSEIKRQEIRNANPSIPVSNSI